MTRLSPTGAAGTLRAEPGPHAGSLAAGAGGPGGGSGRALLEEGLVCPVGLASMSSLLHEAGHARLCDPPHPRLERRRPGEARGREGRAPTRDSSSSLGSAGAREHRPPRSAWLARSRER